jgi:hypothetical protein
MPVRGCNFFQAQEDANDTSNQRDMIEGMNRNTELMMRQRRGYYTCVSNARKKHTRKKERNIGRSNEILRRHETGKRHA